MHLPSVVCPFLRSLLDVGLKGRYDFLDGVTFAHTCDVGAQFSGNWKINIKTGFSHFIDIPHTMHDGAMEYQKGLLKDYLSAMEKYFKKTISPEKLKNAVKLHNEQRALVRKLYELKKQEPPLISGSETLKTLIAIMSLPVDEGNMLLKEAIEEFKNRDNGPKVKPARLLVWGSIIDDTAILNMIESLDANVVMDDTCVGSRAFFKDVQITDDPLDGLAEYYLKEIRCPRTFKETNDGRILKNYSDDLKNRFGYLGDFIKDYKVDGVIMQSLRYCDAHGYEVPGLKDYLKSVGTPAIYLEHNYTEAAFGPLKTRVQSFIEILD
jgi:benzoyl-CoA reductase/2-hydroxyglutaryl-CoA dehydratase subunit BcrC/BadD/HgdB